MLAGVAGSIAARRWHCGVGAEVGELPDDEMDELDASFRLEEGDESGCICPPDLLERGGHRSPTRTPCAQMPSSCWDPRPENRYRRSPCQLRPVAGSCHCTCAT